MNTRNAVIDFIKKNFKAVLSHEEVGELLLLFSYELEANVKNTAAFEIFRNTFDRYIRQRKHEVIALAS